MWHFPSVCLHKANQWCSSVWLGAPLWNKHTKRAPQALGEEKDSTDSFIGTGQKKTATNNRISTWLETLLSACPRKIGLGGLHWTLTLGPTQPLPFFSAGRLASTDCISGHSCPVASSHIQLNTGERNDIELFLRLSSPRPRRQGVVSQSQHHLTCWLCQTLHEALSNNELQTQLFACSGCRISVYTV